MHTKIKNTSLERNWQFYVNLVMFECWNCIVNASDG